MIVSLVVIEIDGLLNLGLYVSLLLFYFIGLVSLLVYSLAVESCLPILGSEIGKLVIH